MDSNAIEEHQCMNIYICKVCGKQFQSVYAEVGHRHTHSQKWIEKRKTKDILQTKPKKLPITTFLDNKYTKWYLNIIQNATINQRNKPYETHHILPRCMGGNNDLSNLIRLTPREHLICHILLTKMVPTGTTESYKLHKAIMSMNRQSESQSRILNTKLIANAKIRYLQQHSKNMSGKGNPMFGMIWISNPEKQVCLRIQKSELSKFLDDGYIQKRILNFDLYKKKKKLSHKNLKKNTIKKNISFTETKDFYEILHLKYIESDLSLRDFAKIHYSKSHVSLYKWFVKLGLEIKNKK